MTRGFLVPTLDSASSSIERGITAHSGGGQANAYQLTRAVNLVSAAAANGDSLKLPRAAAGSQVLVVNSSARSVRVFGYDTASINGVTGTVGISLPQDRRALFLCHEFGAWTMFLSP